MIRRKTPVPKTHQRRPNLKKVPQYSNLRNRVVIHHSVELPFLGFRVRVGAGGEGVLIATPLWSVGGFREKMKAKSAFTKKLCMVCSLYDILLFVEPAHSLTQVLTL